ncbi:MAG: M48 family metalloprotease [Myxococcota bacterium]
MTGETTIPRFPEVDAWGGANAAIGPLADDESKLWSEAQKTFAKLQEEEKIYADDPLQAYLQNLTESIVPPVDETGPKFSLHVLDLPDRNAAALPDGTILLTLGLLAALENEAELAMVIGHEAAHVVKRHSLIEFRYGEITSSHVDRMRLSRRNESEADEFGLALVNSAGYDAAASIHALEHLREEAAADIQFRPAWSSHWNLRFRKSDLKRASRQNHPRGDRITSEAFERAIDPIRLEAALQALEGGERLDAKELIERELARDPSIGRAYFLRAELARRDHPEQRLAPAVGDDYRRAVALAPEDADALRALGLFLRDTGDADASNAMLRRYLAARPDAVDRKIVERYLGGPGGAAAEPAVDRP